MLPRATEPYQTISFRVPWRLFQQLDAYVREHPEATKVGIMVDALTRWFHIPEVRYSEHLRHLEDAQLAIDRALENGVGLSVVDGKLVIDYGKHSKEGCYIIVSPLRRLEKEVIEILDQMTSCGG